MLDPACLQLSLRSAEMLGAFVSTTDPAAHPAPADPLYAGGDRRFTALDNKIRYHAFLQADAAMGVFDIYTERADPGW